MEQLIIGFRLDEVDDWVAILTCGHGQHVRHEPPLTFRPWVLTPQGRQEKIGWPLNCVRCDRGEPPTEEPMEPIDTVHTERLIAERFQPDHFDLLCQIHRNPAVMATLGGVRSDETTRQNLQDYVAHWETHGFGLWLLRDRASRALAGRAGLKWIDVGGNREIELGYTFLPDYWGRGLATEIAWASLAVGFERLGLEELVCFTLTTNFASQRVMEKVGFVFEREIVHTGEAMLLYRLTRKAYRQNING
ncbi:MAG: GNAT family N-acetyltransferase [Caldilineaceae bacterium]